MIRQTPPPDREPARDLEAERTVLGQVLMWPDLYAAHEAHGLQASDFFSVAHRMIWTAAESCAEQGIPPDLPTVGMALRERGWLEEVGPAYLAALVDGIPRPADEHVRSFGTRLRALAQARALRAHAERLQQAIDENPGAIAEGALAEHMRAVDALMQADEETVLNPDHQIAVLKLDRGRERQQGIILGLPTLDNILDGIRPGEVLGVMARPGIGKTLLLCHFAQAFADCGLGHLLISLEMSAAQIVARLARMREGMTRRDLQRAIDGAQFPAARYQEAFAGLRLTDRPGLDVSTIARIARATARQQRLRVISIDHLGLIGGDRTMSTYDRVSTQARELKELAKRQSCAVVVAIQVNRDAGGDGSKLLTLGAARDSGVVEEAMDYLVGMRRFDRATWLSAEDKARYADTLWLSVLKHRHGECGREFAVRFDARSLAITEAPNLDAPREPDPVSMGGRRR